jgi:hypothetical protein
MGLSMKYNQIPTLKYSYLYSRTSYIYVIVGNYVRFDIIFIIKYKNIT